MRRSSSDPWSLGVSWGRKSKEDAARKTSLRSCRTAFRNTFLKSESLFAISIRTPTYPNCYRLPGIIQTINASYDESVASINSLPPPPSNEPALELNSICTAFVKDLENHTVGVAGSESLIQACLSVFKQFRARVNDTAPRFLPYEKAKLWDGGNAAAKNYEEPELLRDDSSPHLVSSERKNLEKRFTADLDDVRRQIQM